VKKAGINIMQESILQSHQESNALQSQVLIDIQQLRKVYTTQSGEVVALRDISLAIRKGDIYGIIGLSGAGKSTLIRCINRLDEPTKGSIAFDGKNVLAMDKKELMKLRRNVSMIFQQFNLLMQKTVAKNIRYPMEIAGVPRQQANMRVKELLKIVGLEEKYSAYPSQLSGGQKQRVAIARALAMEPKVLLCDEATSALDPMTTQSILKLLQDINRQMGITIVLITHEMAVIRQICTHVAILDGGVIAEEGSVDDVFTHTKSQAGKRLFGIVPSEEEPFPQPVPAIRIVFEGGKVADPIIARLVLHLNMPVSILSADVRNINGVQYGQMMIAMPVDPEVKKRAMDFLHDQGVIAEEVTP
jgi:D-methionine transport system ATP-binding protein